MKNIALLYPGQGSQYIGMGKDLYDNHIEAREVFEEANDVLGFDLMNLCFYGNNDELTKTENAQPAILTATVAAFKVYTKEFGINPICTAGHSLGEFSALTCAGSILFSDCLKLVRQRGKFMQEALTAGSGRMVAVLDIQKEIVEEICGKTLNTNDEVYISNYNSPYQTVVSGYKYSIEKISNEFSEKGGRVIPLKVSAPFHSPLMKEAAIRFEEELKKYSFALPKWPVISNVNAMPYKEHALIIKNLKQQTVQPVHWKETMDYIENTGVQIVVEIGPKTVLKTLSSKNIPKVKAFSFDIEADIETLKKELHEFTDDTIINDLKNNVVTKCLAIAVCTRNSNWDNNEYENGVVIPYRNVQKIQELLDEEKRMPTIEESKTAVEMLLSIFETKKVSKAEREYRINELMDSTGAKDVLGEYLIPEI